MLKVIATRDFTVGPDRRVVRDVREVAVNESGGFFTTTNEGDFFGWCKLGNGWQVVELKEEECS